MQDLSEIQKQLASLEDKSQLHVDIIQNNDHKTRFYTGLPNWPTFLAVFQYLEPKASRMTLWCGGKTSKQTATLPSSKPGRKRKLALIDELFAVLCVSTYRKGNKFKWTEDMRKAIDHARKHQNIAEAARLFGVPYSTLIDGLTGRIAIGAKVGHPTTLTPNEEAEIAETCIAFAEWGFGMGRREVESVVKDYLHVTKRKNPFKDGVPGEGWWSGFFKRHPKVVKRKPQQLQMARAKASCPEIISHWFDQCLGPTLEKLDLVGKADRIFNVDESGFPLSWNPTMILTRRGHKSPQAMTPGSGREQITVQTCISGSGQLMAPYVVYKGARVSPYHTIGGPLGTRYKATENGWMNADTFLDWFQLIFIPSLPSCRPVLLLLDGHKSHVGYQIRKVASGE